VGCNANFGGDIVVGIFFFFFIFSAIIVVFSTMIFSWFRNVQFLMFLMMEEDDGLLEDFHFYLFVSRYALSDPSLRFLRF
jgi:hypothetical protein